MCNKNIPTANETNRKIINETTAAATTTETQNTNHNNCAISTRNKYTRWRYSNDLFLLVRMNGPR